MSTLDQLVERIAVLTREVRASDEPVTEKQWEGFDANLHRFLVGTIGHFGSRVPTNDPSADILREVVGRYPTPLPSPLTYSPMQADDSAPGPEQSVTRTVGLPRRGGLQLVPTPDARQCVSLPNPADPRAVARITCALGALADLVDVLEYEQAPVMDEMALRTAHVLAAAAIVSRHTLTHGSLIAGDRPFAVGKHAEVALGALQPVLESAPLRPFRGLPSVADVDVGDTTLERAVNAWSFASEVELRSRIPSADTLHMLVNQGTHIAATLAEVNRPGIDSEPRDPPSALVEAGRALAAADKAWVPGLTTLVKPSTDFITASRGLFLALEDARARSHGFTEPERQRTADNLGQAVATLGHRLTVARSFLRPLADGKALYAPARQVEVSPERLNDRLKGRYVKLEYFDVKGLEAAWRAADVATHGANAVLVRRTPWPAQARDAVVR